MEMPAGWLHRMGDEPADDLDLAVLLLNSVDLLVEPADRLTVAWYAGALRVAGHPELADSLRPLDLAPLRRLRDGLRPVFGATSDAVAAAVLNPLLTQGGAVALLVADEKGGVGLRVAPGVLGFPALAARLPAAVARAVAARGVARLGTCDAGPCACAYVDRTRSGRRRYCCDLCNDRASAAAYRRRQLG
jgi:predicted RNA-binding Zn ribbon-like protein